MQGPVVTFGVAAGWWRPRPDTRARVPAAGRSAVEVDEATGQGQPNPVSATACCTATEGMHHHLRTQLDLTARRTGSRRPPSSAPSRRRRCGPAAASLGNVARLRRSATRSAAPSTSGLHGCGWPVHVNGETSVASQHVGGASCTPAIVARQCGLPVPGPCAPLGSTPTPPPWLCGS